MKKKKTIIFSSILLIVIVSVFIYFSYEYSKLVDAQELLNEEQIALEQDKEEFQKAQDKYEKELEKFKEEKEKLEEEKAAFDEEKKAFEQKMENQSTANQVISEESHQSGYQDTQSSNTSKSQSTYEENVQDDEIVQQNLGIMEKEQELYIELEEIDSLLYRLQSKKNDYPEWSEEYREILNEELQLLERVQEIQQELAELLYK